MYIMTLDQMVGASGQRESWDISMGDTAGSDVGSAVEANLV